jgi:hypothetical protein
MNTRTQIGLPLNGADHTARELLLQRTSVAGLRHHEGLKLWPLLRRGESLSLRREQDNEHDASAVALYFRGRKLGYLPRGANLVAARLLDRERVLRARIERLLPDAEMNQRVRIAVSMLS